MGGSEKMDVGYDPIELSPGTDVIIAPIFSFCRGIHGDQIPETHFFARRSDIIHPYMISVDTTILKETAHLRKICIL